MSLVEIKSAVDELSPIELAELAAFVRGRNQAAWDLKMEQDAATGRLDFLFEEAETERDEGHLREWPSL